MPEWLQDTVATNGVQASLDVLAVRLGLGLILGFVVAAIYFVSQRREKSDVLSMVTTLVLLTVLIAMVTLVIGNSVARAFSLAGALAIIRFRTIVEDTRDTAFVIFAVAVGMAVGAGFPIIPLVGIPIVALATLLMCVLGTAWSRTNGNVGTLTVRLGLGRDPERLLKDLFDTHLDRSRLTCTATARQGAALELTYQVRLRSPHSAISLITELNQLEGIQGAELHR
jgi:hypothetical protein